MEQTIRKDCGGGEKQSDGLVAVEGFVLGFAAGGAFLLDRVTFELVVHWLSRLAFGWRSSGSIAETENLLREVMADGLSSRRFVCTCSRRIVDWPRMGAVGSDRLLLGGRADFAVLEAGSNLNGCLDRLRKR